MAINVALVQLTLAWEQPARNRAACEQAFAALDTDADLIVLPETFSTGFTMRPDPVAEPMNGTTVRWMQSIAAQRHTTICGSLAIREKKQIHNRFVWVHPHEPPAWYDKHHLFAYAGEDQRYAAGNQRRVFALGPNKVRGLICYDLRFPSWCRASDREQLQVYVANWPQPRHLAWQQLLRARAIENQCYVIGVNRCGDDGRGNRYLGGSMVVDFLGNVVCDAGDRPGVCEAALDIDALESFRQEFPFLRDADVVQLHP